MAWHVYLSAVVPRLVFIFHAFIAVWRVTVVMNDPMYWLLLLLNLLIFVEMIVTITIRKGSDYKGFSPALFFYLINVIPPIWILEVFQLYEHMSSNECVSKDNSTCTYIIHPGTAPWTERKQNSSSPFENIIPRNIDWILGLHQTLLIILIIGKWILPMGIGVNRDQLSQLLLMFVGTAADILEFKSETLSDKGVRCCLELVYAILALWTWSMLQFPLDLTVLQEEDEELTRYQIPEWKAKLYKYRADLWNIFISIFIQDGPFFIFRLFLMLNRKLTHQMLLFFTIKNSLVLTLQIYRLVAIYLEIRQPSQRENKMTTEASVAPAPIEMDDITE
ncbi:transmembrane protein 26b [Pristis pectinata]|uniref:transmembrane protein 26b n=1 Tax=Pristis pectinata TaxID=685728 RepID=UPI00223E8470|nr:transmembrane protein 26b [Pristis pectinata]